ATAHLLRARPDLRERLIVAVVGGPSGNGLAEPEHLHKLAASLGVQDVVRFRRPVPQEVLADWYRAATVAVVPSYNESFGLVAIEAQACGTPVVAAAVGGLPTAVRDGVSGILVDGHDPVDYAEAIGRLIRAPRLRERYGEGAVRHAANFGWAAAAASMAEVYAQTIADAGQVRSLAAR
ncbi:MAG: glycosyltransferase, partial [Streptomycetaceae bacterium]|nr:glycosyltransferase [Streptomycetaceae bacterium]